MVLPWWRHTARKRYGVTSLQAEVEHPFLPESPVQTNKNDAHLDVGVAGSMAQAERPRYEKICGQTPLPALRRLRCSSLAVASNQIRPYKHDIPRWPGSTITTEPPSVGKLKLKLKGLSLRFLRLAGRRRPGRIPARCLDGAGTSKMRCDKQSSLSKGAACCIMLHCCTLIKMLGVVLTTPDGLALFVLLFHSSLAEASTLQTPACEPVHTHYPPSHPQERLQPFVS